jgi:cysteine-rich repeat protein
MKPILLALLATTACIQAADVDCGNGLVCPEHMACDVPHHTCVQPPQITACEGQLQDTPCSTVFTPNGVCREGVCMAIACGNGYVDPGEMCDDGNTTSGDGCRADCLSTERCGNGVLDSDLGEQCDDGNLMSHDGCDSRCQIEQLTWIPLTQITAPQYVIAGAYDSTRHELVVIGKDPMFNVPMTGIWDGNAWRQLPLPDPLANRQYTAMAYDEARHRIVLFGGRNGSGDLADTWLWDGTRWSLAPTTSTFGGLSGHTLVYFPDKGVILIGGSSAGVASSDVRRWDGANWVLVSSLHPGPTRTQHVAAYDPGNHGIIVCGGLDEYGTPQTDSWIWNGDWIPLAPNGPAVTNGAMSYSPASDSVIVTGAGVTWRWDRTNEVWSSDAGTSLAQRSQYVSFFDPKAKATMLVGGSNAFAVYDEVQHTWSPITDNPIPGIRATPSLVFDRKAGVLVMAGGTTGGALDKTSTWLLVGATWQLAKPANLPPDPEQQGAVYDEARHVTTLFGALANPDVYTWDGQAPSWTQIIPSGSWPMARLNTAMAYDQQATVTVMFGGNNSGSLGDTWTWNGAAWQPELAAADDPTPRSFHRMVYDSKRDQVALFGGTTFDNTVWQWHAGKWTSLPSSAGWPTGRVRFGMAFDPRLGETVVFGGSNSAGVLTDAWSWNGERWRTLDKLPIKFPQDAISMAYDETLAAMIVYGDKSQQTAGMLRWLSPTGVDEVCDSNLDLDGDGLYGCDDPDCTYACTH